MVACIIFLRGEFSQLGVFVNFFSKKAQKEGFEVLLCHFMDFFRHN
jgi:hypothetical protein